MLDLAFQVKKEVSGDDYLIISRILLSWKSNNA